MKTRNLPIILAILISFVAIYRFIPTSNSISPVVQKTGLKNESNDALKIDSKKGDSDPHSDWGITNDDVGVDKDSIATSELFNN